MNIGLTFSRPARRSLPTHATKVAKSLLTFGLLFFGSIVSNAWANCQSNPNQIGFIDSGLDTTIERFNPYLTQPSSIPTDADGHGTSVVDQFLVETERLQVPNVEIDMVSLTTDSRNIVSAIDTLASNGASVINMSLSFFLQSEREMKAYQNTVKRIKNCTLFVISAGDERISLTWKKFHSTNLPYNNILVVGEVAELGDNFVIQSNFGGRIDLMGIMETTNLLGPDGELVSRKGVSFSVPKVTAAIQEFKIRNSLSNPSVIIKKFLSQYESTHSDGKPRRKIRLFQ